MNNFHNTMQRFTFCTGKAVREEVFFQLISIGISIAYKFHNPACFYGIELATFKIAFTKLKKVLCSEQTRGNPGAQSNGSKG
jgi:hypothetical protein